MKRHISPSQMWMYASCSLRYYFNYILGLKMPGNLNFATGTTVHEVAKELVAMPKDNIDREQLQDTFTIAWNKEVKRAYLTEKDDVDVTRELCTSITDKFIGGYESGEFPYTPVNYLPIGADKQEPALEAGFELPAMNVLDDFKPIGLEGMELYFACSLDIVGTDPDDKLSIIDYKTSKMPYKKSKIMKEPQLPFYDMIFRIASKLGMFPDLLKTKVDSIAYGVILKSKKAIKGDWSDFFQVWSREITDDELAFFYHNMEELVTGMFTGPYHACPGFQCDTMCAHRPVCDAYMKGESPEEAYNNFMFNWEQSKSSS